MAGFMTPTPRSNQRLRFSIIDYLNALPLNMAFKDGLFADRVLLSFDYPSQCADSLATGKADVGLISSVEYQRIPNLVIAPHVCIAAREEVRSVLIVTKKPLSEVSTVALDRFSRSSVALLRVLLHRRFGKRPTFVTMAPDSKTMLAEADAALIIGDAALALQPEQNQVIDLAREWFVETGLPFVFAFWAMHQNIDKQAASNMVLAARDYGLPLIESRMEAIQQRWPFETEAIKHYFAENIHYHMGAAEHQSLLQFFTYAFEAGLIPQPKPLNFVGL